MFQFTELSSGQFLQQSEGTFSECAHYGIQCCLQIILTLKIMLNSVGRCIIWNTYKNSCQYIFVKIFKIMLAYIRVCVCVYTHTHTHIYIYICIYITSKTMLFSDGIVCLWSLPILSHVCHILNSGELVTSIF